MKKSTEFARGSLYAATIYSLTTHVMYVVWVYMSPESTPISSAAKTTLVTTRLEEDAHAELTRRALLADRTIAAELRRAVRFYLEQSAEAAA